MSLRHFDAGAVDGGDDSAHLFQSRYASVGDLLEFRVFKTDAFAPSFPFAWIFRSSPCGLNGENLTVLTCMTSQSEFVDTIDIPAQHRLVFRVTA